jgi:hypothetical protein
MIGFDPQVTGTPPKRKRQLEDDSGRVPIAGLLRYAGSFPAPRASGEPVSSHGNGRGGTFPDLPSQYESQPFNSTSPVRSTWSDARMSYGTSVGSSSQSGVVGDTMQPRTLSGSSGAFVPGQGLQGAESTFGHGQPTYATTTLLSPEQVSPTALSALDDYACDPTFMELQEELRALLFNTANSNAPTRCASPDRQDAFDDAAEPEVGPARDKTLQKPRNFMKEIVCTSKRTGYLRNYIGEVAPWVSKL